MSILDYRPNYSNSYALVIGINEYKSASPLAYAVNDAKVIARVLTEDFSFPKDNVSLLLDKKATRSAITKRFLSFAFGGAAINDRVFVFFAGHGLTSPSRSGGEVGFLVPYDGDQKNYASLIRWDELTRSSDLIEAKHILFLMDACYGGLAITRTLKPGAMRFLKDMLLRSARQVLTAGKADEPVADYGGPRPGHSVFTGHLLEGLSGEAADPEGVITANGLMAYVHLKVSRDPNSKQTPHYGYLDGDGDFIFSASWLSEEHEDNEKG
ncbi:MAG: caspase family protein, partial [Deltaproteobacteria bacterium]|nr:caspase family protein [Deltaproteobacteria bacterium]